MHPALWRAACILTAAGGAAFGLWAGAVIVRADAQAIPHDEAGAIEMTRVPVVARPAKAAGATACEAPGQSSSSGDRAGDACEEKPAR